MASPASKQHWPNSAACWSPRTAATRTPFSGPSTTSPKSPPTPGRTSASVPRGTPNAASRLSSQSSVSCDASSVRAAFVESVANRPVSRDSSHESTVPNRTSPRAAGTFSRRYAILVPLKYVATGSPVWPRKRSTPPSRLSRSQRSAVRASLHTIALWTGSPVARSQATVVSRWFVSPTAATSPAVTLAFQHRPLDHGFDGLPQLRRVVLDPPGPRRDLPVLPLRRRHGRGRRVEQDAARRGRPGVDRGDEVWHPGRYTRRAEAGGPRRREGSEGPLRGERVQIGYPHLCLFFAARDSPSRLRGPPTLRACKLPAHGQADRVQRRSRDRARRGGRRRCA